jgi:pseudouridine kinase
MYKKNKPYVLVFGASVVDIFGICNKGIEYRVKDSNPGKVRMEFGGVSRNIAENMARIGLNTKFISILGDDEKGRAMLDHSELIGYDMGDSLILEGGRTPSYLAILDQFGEMVSAVVDMESISAMNTEFIDSKAHLIEGAEFTFLDADDPENLEYILKKFCGKTKFILDPVSSEKSSKIKDLIKYFHTIKPNKNEAEVLAGFPINTDEDLERAGKYFIDLGVEKVFISLDAEGVFYTDGVNWGRIKALDVTVKNVTGAGDSFVAGLGFGYIHGMSIEELVKFAMSMSIITISYEGTIHPDMELLKITQTMKEISWDEKYFNK